MSFYLNKKVLKITKQPHKCSAPSRTCKVNHSRGVSLHHSTWTRPSVESGQVLHHPTAPFSSFPESQKLKTHLPAIAVNSRSCPPPLSQVQVPPCQGHRDPQVFTPLLDRVWHLLTQVELGAMHYQYANFEMPIWHPK